MSTLNVIRVVLNSDGSILDVVNGFIASMNSYSNTIQVVAPFPDTDSLAVNYYLRNARVTNYTQYLRLLRDTNGVIQYGKDIVEPERNYYQQVKDYNVWQIAISSKALRAISKYHAGKVDLSITVREYKNYSIEDTMLYKGTFGSNKSTTRGDIPLTATDGDYYRCDALDFYSTHANLDFTVLDLAIYDVNRWILGASYEERLVSPSTVIGVDPSVYGVAIEDVETSITEQILDRIAGLEAAITGEYGQENLADMFVRKNIDLYYDPVVAGTQPTDLIYVEQSGVQKTATVQDLHENLDYIEFDKTYTPTVRSDGTLFYDNATSKQTLTFVNTYANGETQEINLGQELFTICKNINGTLVDGQVVCWSGVQGDHTTFLPASADSAHPELNTMIGVLTTMAYTNNFVPVVCFGEVSGIDLTLVMETGTVFANMGYGSRLYLSAISPGKYSLLAPVEPNASIWVATVIVFNAQYKQARIFVHPVVLRVEAIATAANEIQTSIEVPTDPSIKIWYKIVTA